MPLNGNLQISSWGFAKLLTLVNQDQNITALQVKTKEEEWIWVDPIPRTFVVNIGDMLTIWTNGVYQSALHRVINNNGKYHVSVPFFLWAKLQRTCGTSEFYAKFSNRWRYRICTSRVWWPCYQRSVAQLLGETRLPGIISISSGKQGSPQEWERRCKHSNYIYLVRQAGNLWLLRDWKRMYLECVGWIARFLWYLSLSICPLRTRYWTPSRPRWNFSMWIRFQQAWSLSYWKLLLFSSSMDGHDL